MPKQPVLTVRKLLAITPEMAKAIEDYRFQHRIATESEATRRLIDHGLAADKTAVAGPGRAQKRRAQ